MAFHVVIPARHASTRLPGKPLLDIAGSTMIQRVVERAAASGANEVLVATTTSASQLQCGTPGERGDDRRHDGSGIAFRHRQGGGRCTARGWSADTIVVNVQGDEPFVPPALIDQVAGLLERDSQASIATLATPIESLHDFLDPNVVKVVMADDGAALYFSRARFPGRAMARLPVLQPVCFRRCLSTHRHLCLSVGRCSRSRRCRVELRTGRKAGTVARAAVRPAHCRGPLRRGAGARHRYRSGPRARPRPGDRRIRSKRMNEPFHVFFGVTLTLWKLIGISA